MAVPKSDGTVRLCGDYKVTANPVLDVNQYPQPRPDDLMTSILGGKRFTKLDLMAAYQQMPLNEESRKYVTVNTHLGLYRNKRLPFGIAFAPAVFQQAMDAILQGLTYVICYLEDILITRSTDQQHLENLEEVLSRLKQHGIRLKKNKCQFLQDAVEYLRHQIDAQRIRTATSKLEAILQAPTPRNVTEVRSFLGMINYYGKFLPNLVTLCHPLNELFKLSFKWKWSRECEAAFLEAKQLLSGAPVLAQNSAFFILTMIFLVTMTFL